MKTKVTPTLSLLGLTLLAGLILHAADAPSTAPSPAATASDMPAATPDKRKDEFRARMAQRLGLTADQQAKLDALHQKQRAEIDAILQDNSLDADAKRAKMRGVADSCHKQRLAILTPEQQEKIGRFREHFKEGGPRFARFQGEGHRGFGPMMAGGGPGFGPLAGELGPRENMKDRIAEKLGLTDDQRDKMEHIGRDIRAKQRELMKSYHDQMRAVLTPEQQKQADDWKEQRGAGHPPFHAMFDGPARGDDDLAPAPADDTPPPPAGEPSAR